MATYAHPEQHVYLDATITDIHHRQIVLNLIENFGLKVGDAVVELGAGSGRYTELLLECGLKVIALEPDTVLAKKLRTRLGNKSDLQVLSSDSLAIGSYPNSVKAVCGFHVLHHIRGEELKRLYSLFDQLFADRPSMSGWFFLEPNPFCPLYAVQILLTPGMSLKEERGIWQHYPQSHAFAENVRYACGLFPPRSWVNKLGDWATKGTGFTNRRMFWNLYQIVGARRTQALLS